MTARLPPLLRPGLKVVIVGTRPGDKSLRTGHYYANPTNSFYRSLHQAHFTPRQLAPHEFRDLLAYGVGLDDVYDDPTGLGQRLSEASPLAVCFNSREALEAYGAKITGDWKGPAASRYASIRGVRVLWAVPDSSGQAARFLAERLKLLEQLRKRLHGDPK